MAALTDAWLTILCAGLTTVAVTAIVAFSHQKMTATLTAAWNGKSASVVIAGATAASGSAAAGGGFGPLVWIPAWKQTGGLLPDGRRDPQEDNDCGETCVAMVVAAVRGVAVEPGAIRQALGGTNRSGLTTPEDLVLALADNHVVAHIERVDRRNGWMLLAACYGVAKPAIVLGYWLNLSCLHWMLLVDKSPGQFMFIDPWTGGRHNLTMAQWDSLYAGAMVVVDDRPMYDSHLMPTPGTGTEA